MVGIKVLVVLAVAAFDLAVVPGRKRPDLLVADAELSQSLLKHGKGLLLAVPHLIGKLKAIIGLDTFDGKGKLFHDMLQKLCGGVGTVLLKSLQIPETAVFVNEGVLIPLCAILLPDNTGLRDKFHIDLHTLAGILHLLIGLGDILWIRQLNRLAVNPAQQLMQP